MSKYTNKDLIPKCEFLENFQKVIETRSDEGRYIFQFDIYDKCNMKVLEDFAMFECIYNPPPNKCDQGWDFLIPVIFWTSESVSTVLTVDTEIFRILTAYGAKTFTVIFDYSPTSKHHIALLYLSDVFKQLQMFRMYIPPNLKFGELRVYKSFDETNSFFDYITLDLI